MTEALRHLRDLQNPATRIGGIRKMIAGPGGPSSEGWTANCHALAWDSGPQDGADCE